jgi:acetylornithine deacetylase/succinyl-diaminopimelate desuccinylase-like protein
VHVSPAPEPRGGPASPLTNEVLGPIERLTKEMWPGIPVVPVMATGATDGRALRQKGIPTYGVSGLFGDMDDSRAHGRDERMLIKSGGRSPDGPGAIVSVEPACVWHSTA